MYAETYILLCNNISKERSRHLFGSVWTAYTLTHTHTLFLCSVKPLESFTVDIFAGPLCLSRHVHAMRSSLAPVEKKTEKFLEYRSEHGKSTDSMKN